MSTLCTELRENIVELVEGTLDGTADSTLDHGVAARLTAHVAECAACEREVRLESRLVASLRALPAAPDHSVSVPELGSVEGAQVPRPLRLVPRRLVPRRLVPLRLAAVVAVAAAALVVVGVRFFGGAAPVEVQSETFELAGSRRAVEIRTVMESSDDVPLPDDDLLALTAGVEAVVMRRPAQRR